MWFFKQNFGIIIQLITYITVIFFNIMKIKRSNLFTYKCNNIIIYMTFCTSLFITMWYIEPFFYETDELIYRENGYQYALVTLSIGLIFQILALSITKDIFYKMIIPALISLIFDYSIFFFLYFGIISSVWFLIFTMAMVGFIFQTFIFESIKIVLEKVKNIHTDNIKKETLESIKDDQNKFFRISIQILLALAASIGVSMSILFQGGSSKWDDNFYLFAAATMIFAYSMILFGFLIWIIKPFLSNFLRVRYYYEKYFDELNTIIKPK